MRKISNEAFWKGYQVKIILKPSCYSAKIIFVFDFFSSKDQEKDFCSLHKILNNTRNWSKSSIFTFWKPTCYEKVLCKCFSWFYEDFAFLTLTIFRMYLIKTWITSFSRKLAHYSWCIYETREVSSFTIKKHSVSNI